MSGLYKQEAQEGKIFILTEKGYEKNAGACKT